MIIGNGNSLNLEIANIVKQRIKHDSLIVSHNDKDLKQEVIDGFKSVLDCNSIMSDLDHEKLFGVQFVEENEQTNYNKIFKARKQNRKK